ncbi:MAG: UDP-N-acetylmuramate dehydrogenase [Candidatus Omnitrophica bacterium]|nr:UDP-N-acetylmuramate dehydrogenase [Candidatus Omnitrophota bacterium]
MGQLMQDRFQKVWDNFASRVTYEEPLSEHSRIRIGGKVFAWVKVSDTAELVKLQRMIKSMGMRYIVAGNCSNILFPDGTLEAFMLELAGEPFRGIELKGREVYVGAGVLLADLISYCCDRGLSGLEGLVGIPATVGGALANNASYKTTISDRLLRVKVLDRGLNEFFIGREDIKFSYRYSSLQETGTITGAVFSMDKSGPEELKERCKDLFREKMQQQPLERNTLGCVFKNPSASRYTSGQMIEEAGMKGKRAGGAVISEKHANFIENTGGARASDVRHLIDRVRTVVRERFEVDLETEIEIIT